MTDHGDATGAGPVERVAGGPRLLCERFLEALPVTSASVAVFDGGGRQSTICASDSVASRLDELQLELGEGPQWDALRIALPILVPSLRDEPSGQWPVFTSGALELGVLAIFAFPMFLGAVSVGVVGLSSSTAGALDATQIATAASLARSITRRAVQVALDGAHDDEGGEALAAPAMRREVHQATGMILAQLDVTATEAFFRLRAHAFAASQSVQDVAHAVVRGELDFRELPR